MAGIKANRFMLSVRPVDYSLTAGTNIPRPLDSPPRSPAGSFARPPTSGGGPLTSHPTTPDDLYVPGAFPPTPEPEWESNAKTSTSTATTKGRQDSFRTPLSPIPTANTYQTVPSPDLPKRRPSGMRKLLSLTSLRSSFSSSRTSLHIPQSSNDPQYQPPYPQYNARKRPSSPSIASTTACYYQPSVQSHAPEQRPELRTMKSGSWLRRKSGMFLPSSSNAAVADDGMLDAVDENQRPDTGDSKRLKESESEPAPLLPEVGTLRGGRLGGGEIGWDESLFGR
ncbi:hypothetical protein LTR35_002989 [Friedmanniomyces endolithicus]|nr:hypothetical protein LTS00_012365 [Friedmanniomyces endolithicus]KAK0289790.1 hypothetical protein LTR35_002989 [Friedmanniomyces endolithicus]KAK1019869.1 hypothetical protein LTR54_000513 [Friedmanniomyces endolithicus]